MTLKQIVTQRTRRLFPGAKRKFAITDFIHIIDYSKAKQPVHCYYKKLGKETSFQNLKQKEELIYNFSWAANCLSFVFKCLTNLKYFTLAW